MAIRFFKYLDRGGICHCPKTKSPPEGYIEVVRDEEAIDRPLTNEFCDWFENELQGNYIADATSIWFEKESDALAYKLRWM